MKNQELIDQAKKYQLKIIDDHGEDPYNMRSHLAEAERWAYKLLKMYPKADKNAILLSVWLHDTGHYTGSTEIDHAIKSEKLARKFLSGKADKDLTDKVCAIVRAHRCKDVLPKTLDEKIMACLDSASHMTDKMYIDIVKNGRYTYCLAKIERDFRDLNLIPEIKKEMKPIYKNWVSLIKSFKKLGVFEETKSTKEVV